MSSLLDRVDPAPATPVVTDPSPVAALRAQAAAVDLPVRAAASWPESAADDVLPQVAGFVVSSFNPLAAEVAERCLRRRPDPDAPQPVTAVIVVSSLGDVASAVHVADTVDAGKRVRPLLFFQSVPNAVAGYIAARWQLTGPVVCVATVETGLSVAALLIADGDADEALIIRVDQAGGGSDRAAAILVGPGASGHRTGPVQAGAGEHHPAVHSSEGGRP